eukprot:7136623-Pyramimonas_sp.AAC.1
MRRVISRARASAPGPDGAPRAGWGTEEGINALAHALRWMALGRPMSARFARALAVFLPKGTREADKDGVVRPASDT